MFWGLFYRLLAVVLTHYLGGEHDSALSSNCILVHSVDNDPELRSAIHQKLNNFLLSSLILCVFLVSETLEVPSLPHIGEVLVPFQAYVQFAGLTAFAKLADIASKTLPYITLAKLHSFVTYKGLTRKSQRGLSGAQNGYSFGMIPGHGLPDVNLSS